MSSQRKPGDIAPDNGNDVVRIPTEVTHILRQRTGLGHLLHPLPRLVVLVSCRRREYIGRDQQN